MSVKIIIEGDEGSLKTTVSDVIASELLKRKVHVTPYPPSNSISLMLGVFIEDYEALLRPSTYQLIRQWATDRNLTSPDRRAQQMLKMTEEVGELASGIAKGREEVVKDSIGDCVVVLTILAMQSGLTIEECVEHAYEQIANRKGKTVGGVFVKDE